MTKHVMILSSLVAANTFTSCVELSHYPDPNYCTNGRGDETCAEQYPDGSRPYCLALACLGGFHGCSPDVPEGCASPCGKQNAEDCEAGETTTSASDSDSESTSAAPVSDSSVDSTTGLQPCEVNDDCEDAAAPFCEPATGECVACDATPDPDGSCAALDPLAPLCAGGICVECTPENPIICDEQLLLCDGASNVCVPCVEHAQCESGACELAVGLCFPADTVIHVDGDGGQDLTSITLAVGSIDEGMHGVIVVHERDGGADYGAVLINGGKTIALLAAPMEEPILQGTGGSPGLRLEGVGTNAYVDGMTISLTTSSATGVRVSGALGWLDRSRIIQNTGGGIVVENGADLRLRNCFVGGDVNDEDALTVNGASATIVYSTIAGGNGSFGMARALVCSDDSSVDVRNSFLVAIDDVPELACTPAIVSNSVSETPVPGSGNATLGPVQAGWFLDYGEGDFHLASPPAAVASTAVWEVGDPDIDIDGNARPATEGSPDHAGADIP